MWRHSVAGSSRSIETLTDLKTFVCLKGESLWMPTWITPSTRQWRACFKSSSEASSRCATKICWSCFGRRSCREFWWAKESTTGRSSNRYSQEGLILLFVCQHRRQNDHVSFYCAQNTFYEGFYHAGHPTIQMFWEVFDELTEDQRKDFLCKYQPSF